MMALSRRAVLSERIHSLSGASKLFKTKKMEMLLLEMCPMKE
jgi:hypothetical protein